MAHVRTFHPQDESDLIRLWKTVFPAAPAHNDPHADIYIKLSQQPELFFVALEDERLVGSVMAGFDGHRGWVYYVAVHPEYRRKGIGTALMQKAESALEEIGCPKLNLQIRTDNHPVRAFYESLGYEIEERISMGKKLVSERNLS